MAKDKPTSRKRGKTTQQDHEPKPVVENQVKPEKVIIPGMESVPLYVPELGLKLTYICITSWTSDDHALSWALIAAITDNKNIKNGLFPPTGAHASTVKGGGNHKTEWQWRIAIILFKDHPVYGDVFKPAFDANDLENKERQVRGAAVLRKPWVDRIKN